MAASRRAEQEHQPQVYVEGPEDNVHEYEDGYIDDTWGSGAKMEGGGPYRACIVWCPIPLLTWMCPWVGHLGISTSAGLLHDFAGPYHINRHPSILAFGRPTKYYQVNLEEELWGGSPEESAKKWDAAVESASATFACRMLEEQNATNLMDVVRSMTQHNLLWNNCHSHVAHALNALRFKRSTNWNTLTLIIFMMLHSHYPSWRHVIQTYLPFLVLLTLFVLFVSFIAS